MKEIVALFDFDGVISDTEGLYTEFWNAEGMKYFSDKDFGMKIKGQTLKHLSKYFSSEAEFEQVIRDIDDFERSMPYDFIPGVWEFLCELKAAGIPTAIVTSSNDKKMENVWRAHPELKEMVTAVLTSNDFTASKPDPECFLKAMEVLGGSPERSIVFEDSIHGIQAGKNSGAFVVGLSTTFPKEMIEDNCHLVIPDFKDLKIESLLNKLNIK